MLTNQPFYKRAEREDHAFLLLHGLGGGVYEMCTIGERLHGLGHSVKAINYPGHDRPALQMPVSQWQDWYGHVEESYQVLASEHESVSVVAFSTGCLLGLHLAASHPVRSQVLMAPFMRVRPYLGLQAEPYLKRIGHLMPGIPRITLPLKDKSMHTYVHQAAYFKTFNIGAARNALELIALVEKELPQVDVPTLILHSRKDSVVCPTSVDILMEKLPCAENKACWLTESDHIITLDVERELVLRHIEEFIRP